MERFAACSPSSVRCSEFVGAAAEPRVLVCAKAVEAKSNKRTRTRCDLEKVRLPKRLILEFFIKKDFSRKSQHDRMGHETIGFLRE